MKVYFRLMAPQNVIYTTEHENVCDLVTLDDFRRERNRISYIKIIFLDRPGPLKQKGGTVRGVLKVLFVNLGYVQKIPSQTLYWLS